MHALHGKTILLTGASRGIGRALAAALAREGVNLVINARGEKALRDTHKLCSGLDGRVEWVAGDASLERTVSAMAGRAQAMGELYGFIHAAGVFQPGPYMWELEPTAFDTVFQANVGAAHCLARACLPPLLAQGQGLAVFFGSGAAQKTQPGIAAYCAAKAAEEHLARQLAAEAPDVVSLVYRPGIVETRMQQDARQSEGGAANQLHTVFRAWKERNMLLTPEQSAAGLVELLRSDLPRLHGQTWDVREM